ncbi:MAG: polynucleotide adenylyltransferase PcnB [Candidatus Competibacteraceae bacterium]|uniref:Poly(A) polymerase I n=1 Tax=Candidatus Contendobacter odensis Run_B_J11 TaxID=1400861 RepID=A0A7U7J473_9GAMM|nr:polynucleotide adenylyltransferase PcnB [Candidatus Contendobacter odensis]MBK8537746.1 polynucleotide adenylyltransferase PcnB [Candidatus Competibacteraceae bacterium]MBK8750709.1 polynucleotide adenylyltransferase PcnB [Candidatus Competibacteraceae bacterium]CDH44957.1 poly(A) polymerase I [Candidatus Contendobacter odensis Run_B_J11]
MESRSLNTPPVIIPRPDHNISRVNISPNAVKVLYRLREAGYRACLVGGGVRDLLLGREPKDFDIATDARPEQVYKLFRNCRLIGRRFRLAHVQFGQEIIEVATFRAYSGEDSEDSDSPSVERADDGRILSDNVYGSIEEDAWRRDFTINALYYDINNFAVLDYVGGMADLKAGLIRLIGDPAQHYHEDPVRLLRAVRFAAKLGFRFDPETEAPLHRLGHLLDKIPPARLCDEILKLFLGGSALQTFELLRHYRLFGWLFPATERCLGHQQQHYPKTLLIRALSSTDARLAKGQPINPAFLFAALLWEPLREQMRQLQAADDLNEHDLLQTAAEIVVQTQIRHAALPRRYSLPMREIWALQQRLMVITGKHPQRLLTHPRFRAGYDFLLLRADTDEQAAELADWWTRFLALDDAGRIQATQPEVKAKKGKARRRRKPRSRKTDPAAPPSPKT